ncbi:MAG: redoxin domain-containing protein [Niabella sp.]
MKYLLSLLFVVFSFAAMAQEQPPYLKYRTLPSARLLLADSTGWELKAKLDKKKPVMLIVFSPECDHCKHETEELVKNMDKLRDIQIIMVCMLSLDEMRTFVAHYGLDKYKNITVARDYAYAFPVYYGLKSLPFHAFYNKDKKLINGFEGTMTTQKILAQFGK